jgi:hypothetical protein
MRSMAASGVVNDSTGEYVLTNAVPIVLELRHACTSTQATNGFGYAANLATEVYSRVTIFKLT